MAISFKGALFPPDIILMGVRWYVAYPLSTRHVEELMEERGVEVDHSTINRWVIKESREMLGIIDQLRYNGLDHSPATRTRRSFCMRVKLHLVLCSNEGSGRDRHGCDYAQQKQPTHR